MKSGVRVKQRRRTEGGETGVIGVVGAPARPIVDRGSLAIQRIADFSILRVESPAKKGGYGAKLRNVTVEPLDWYMHRSQISREQFRAGDRVRMLHYAAHGSGYATTNLDAFHGTTSHAENWRFSSRQAHAMKALSETLAVLKHDERLMVERVVVWGEFAGAVARRRLGIAERKGIAVLRQALTRISEDQNRS